jgi:hypothetical protein
MEKLVLNLSDATKAGRKSPKRLGQSESRARATLRKQGITIWPSGDGVTFEGKALQIIEERAKEAGCSPSQMFSRIIASWVTSSGEKSSSK